MSDSPAVFDLADEHVQKLTNKGEEITLHTGKGKVKIRTSDYYIGKSSEPEANSDKPRTSGEPELRTAAEFVDTGKDSNLPAVEPKNWILDEWKDGDELVRRSDVEDYAGEKVRQERQELAELIQDKIEEKLEENKERKDRLLPIADNAVHGELRAEKAILEELLEEVGEVDSN